MSGADFRKLQVGEIEMHTSVCVGDDYEMPGTWAFNPETGVAYLLNARLGNLQLSHVQIAQATGEQHLARQSDLASDEFCEAWAAMQDQAAEDRAERWAAE